MATDGDRSTLRARRPPPRTPSLLLGLGLGGFVDGIVLHQILQWHHMVSAVEDAPPGTLAGLELNTTADGFFHVATWLLVVAASVTSIVAWRAGRLPPNWNFHLGLVLTGWGIFNLVEGLVDHHLLGVHHVRDDLGGPVSWDVGFLLLGLLLVAVGWLLHLRGLRTLQRSAGPEAAGR